MLYPRTKTFAPKSSMSAHCQKQNSDGIRYLHNSRFCRGSLDLAHVPMVHAGHLTIVPGDRDCIPTRCGDNAAISGITLPRNAVALLEASRFDGIHRHLLIVRSLVRATSALPSNADV